MLDETRYFCHCQPWCDRCTSERASRFPGAAGQGEPGPLQGGELSWGTSKRWTKNFHRSDPIPRGQIGGPLFSRACLAPLSLSLLLPSRPHTTMTVPDNTAPLQTTPNVPQDHLATSAIIYGAGVFSQRYNPIQPHWPGEACRRAIDLGINTFDTSPYYGNSEHMLGEALLSISSTHPRSSYYLSTKVGRYGAKRDQFDYSRKRTRESVQESMRRLHTDYLDVVFAHDVEFVSVDEAVEAVDELFRLKVRSDGIDDRLRRFVWIKWSLTGLSLLQLGARPNQECGYQWYVSKHNPLTRPCMSSLHIV